MLFLTVAAIGCSKPQAPRPKPSSADYSRGTTQVSAERDQQLVEAIDAAMQALVAPAENGSPSAVHSAVIDVAVPDRGFEHAVAVGVANAGSAASMTVGHQFHLASVAKVMTATLILQLWEEGKFGPKGLETTLAEIGVFNPAVLDRLLLKNGVSYGPDLTLRQLLTHSTGMRDVQMDDETGVGADFEEWVAPGALAARFMGGIGEHMACLEDPDCDIEDLYTTRRWVAWDPERPGDPEAGVVNYYLNHHDGAIAASALFLPGEGFHYSDTGFMILALVAEKVGGASYHGLLRERIFDPLGMENTYLAYGVDPDPGPWEHEVSDPWVGDVPLVTAGFNLSFDWGGGGVVSTAAELNRFLMALLAGELFDKPETLAAMTDWVELPGMWKSTPGYGLAIYEKRTDEGFVIWGHDGAWGAVMYYDPESGAFISGTVNQLMGAPSGWYDRLFEIVREHFGVAEQTHDEIGKEAAESNKGHSPFSATP